MFVFVLRVFFFFFWILAETTKFWAEISWWHNTSDPGPSTTTQPQSTNDPPPYFISGYQITCTTQAVPCKDASHVTTYVSTQEKSSETAYCAFYGPECVLMAKCLERSQLPCVTGNKIWHAVCVRGITLLHSLSIRVTVGRRGQLALLSECVQTPCEVAQAAVRKDVVVGFTCLGGSTCWPSSSLDCKSHVLAENQWRGTGI